jgi:thiol:disulfide interchange protein
LIYFFWWNALVQLVVDFYFRNRNKNAIFENKKRFEFGSLFLMGVYWVFIVVFFGFIAGSGNDEKDNKMVALALFFFVIIGLILLLIPLMKKVLNDYELTLEDRSGKFIEEKPNALQQAMNQSLEQCCKSWMSF